MKPTAAKKTTPAPASPAAKPSLEQLTARWATAKHAEETGKREADRLKEEILRDPRAKSGYEDDSLKITESSKLDLEDKALERALEDEGVLEEAYEKKLSTTKIRALATLKPAIAKAVEKATAPSIRFEQAAKKKA